MQFVFVRVDLKNSKKKYPVRIPGIPVYKRFRAAQNTKRIYYNNVVSRGRGSVTVYTEAHFASSREEFLFSFTVTAICFAISAETFSSHPLPGSRHAYYITCINIYKRYFRVGSFPATGDRGDGKSLRDTNYQLYLATKYKHTHTHTQILF